jgi:hypothetical protein
MVVKENKKTGFVEPVKKCDFTVVFLPDGRPAPAVLTGDEVALFLRLDGVGQRTLKFWRDQGKLIGVRLGRRVRYRLEDVLTFLAKKAGEKQDS